MSNRLMWEYMSRCSSDSVSMSESTSGRFRKNVRYKFGTSEFLSNRISKCIADKVSVYMSDVKLEKKQMSECIMSYGMSEAMSDRVSNCLRDRDPEFVLNRRRECMSDRVSTHMRERRSEFMLDRMCVSLCRREGEILWLLVVFACDFVFIFQWCWCVFGIVLLFCFTQRFSSSYRSIRLSVPFLFCRRCLPKPPLVCFSCCFIYRILHIFRCVYLSNYEYPFMESWTPCFAQLFCCRTFCSFSAHLSFLRFAPSHPSVKRFLCARFFFGSLS